MRLTLHTRAIDTQQLVTSLETTVTVGNTTWDDARDVDGRVLLLTPHHIEPETLLGLGQLHHPEDDYNDDGNDYNDDDNEDNDTDLG